MSYHIFGVVTQAEARQAEARCEARAEREERRLREGYGEAEERREYIVQHDPEDLFCECAACLALERAIAERRGSKAT